LLVVVGLITQFVTWLGQIPGGFAVFGVVVVLFTTLTLLAGPLMALQGLGVDVGSILGGLGSKIKGLGDTSKVTAAEQDVLAGSQEGVGSTGNVAAAEEDYLAGSQTYAGESATIASGEVDTFAASEDVAGAGALIALGPLVLVVAAIAALAIVVIEFLAHAGLVSGATDNTTNALGLTHYTPEQITARAANNQKTIGDPMQAQINQFTANPVGYVGQSAGMLGGQIGGDISGAFGGANQKAVQQDTNVRNQIKAGWNSLGAYLTGAWNNTVSTITLIGERIYTRMLLPTLAYMKGAWNNTGAYFQGVWNNTVAFLEGAWNNAVAFVVVGAQQIYSAGANSFWGIYNAVVAALAAAWSYIQSFVTSAVNALQQLWNTATTGNPNGSGNAAGDPHTANNLTGAAHIATTVATPKSNVTHHTTINVGTVDSNERVEQLKDTVIQAITKENDIHGA
jgi:hypothetical protein